MNNSVFGETMEDVRNRDNTHLTLDKDNALKWFSKIEFKHANYIDGLYLIQTHKTATVYDNTHLCWLCYPRLKHGASARFSRYHNS